MAHGSQLFSHGHTIDSKSISFEQLDTIFILFYTILTNSLISKQQQLRLYRSEYSTEAYSTYENSSVSEKMKFEN